MAARLDQLLIMLQKEPSDPFLLYGIAMEYKKQNNSTAALEYFSRTLSADAGYCYAYFQMGQVNESTGDIPAAKKAYNDGIAAARKKGDGHAEQEITSALEMLEAS
jgi:tetratricopeptide (TPR) repeat protein